jgi:hypothetical protein
VTIDALTIAYATIAVLALPHILTVGRALLGDGGATIKPRLTVRQPAPVPQPVTVGVNAEAYAAALAIVTQWHRERVMEDLAKVLNVGPVS